jgi:hypothetical protein
VFGVKELIVYLTESNESVIDVHAVQQCLAIKEMREKVKYCNLDID